MFMSKRRDAAQLCVVNTVGCGNICLLSDISAVTTVSRPFLCVVNTDLEMLPEGNGN